MDAFAAGVSWEEWLSWPISRVYAKIEGWKLRTMYAAMPMIEYELSKISDEDFDKWLREEKTKGKKEPHPQRVKMKRDRLAQYAPNYLFNELTDPLAGIQTLENMSGAAARGILEAHKQGYLSGSPERDTAWASISRIWQQVVATAKRT